MQKQWSFHDALGRFYVIGFYHSQKTGNFLLYINNTISVIDFHIKDTKDYSFIIGNRLLKFTIEKSGHGFAYRLEDKTQHPKPQQWEIWRDRIAAVLMIGAVACGATFLILLFTGVINIPK